MFADQNLNTNSYLEIKFTFFYIHLYSHEKGLKD